MSESNERMMWRQDESGRVAHAFEPVVLVTTLALIPVIVIESDVGSTGWRDVAAASNWAIWAVFLVELVFVLVVAPRKVAALRAHWLDATIVVVTVPALGSFLSALRLARLARLLRFLRLGVLAARALQRERRLTSDVVFRFVALVTVLIVVVSGAVESLVDSGDFPSIWDGVWWAVVTVTTVGYGDVYPTSIAGRVVAMVVMFAGIGFLSVLTATIASRFVQTDTSTEEITAALKRIEGELLELKEQIAGR